MCSISKRIGDIRLSDFKALFDRPGFYRYHFKAVDQEFGMVKEEVGYDKYIDVSQEKHDTSTFQNGKNLGHTV